MAKKLQDKLSELKPKRQEKIKNLQNKMIDNILSNNGININLNEVRITKREHDVLLGLSQGLSNKGLATLLGIKTRTIETHVSNLLGKFAVNTRLELISNFAILKYRVENIKGYKRQWKIEKD